MLVGRLLSYWEGSLSGAMLQLAPRFAKKKSRQVNHLLMALVFRSAGDLLQRKTGQMVRGFRHLQMGVSKNSGTPKSSILNHFNRVFHYKPSILGYPYFWKHPKDFKSQRPHAFLAEPWSWVTQTMLASFFSEKVSIKICGNKNQTK